MVDANMQKAAEAMAVLSVLFSCDHGLDKKNALNYDADKSY